MDAVEALGLLRTLGLTITAEAGRLIVQPAELLDDDLRLLIRKHRDEIFEKVAIPLPTKPTEGVDRVASAGEPPKPILSPSGLWYFIPTVPLSPPMSAPGDIGLMDGLEVEF